MYCEISKIRLLYNEYWIIHTNTDAQTGGFSIDTYRKWTLIDCLCQQFHHFHGNHMLTPFITNKPLWKPLKVKCSARVTSHDTDKVILQNILFYTAHMWSTIEVFIIFFNVHLQSTNFNSVRPSCNLEQTLFNSININSYKIAQ